MTLAGHVDVDVTAAKGGLRVLARLSSMNVWIREEREVLSYAVALPGNKEGPRASQGLTGWPSKLLGVLVFGLAGTETNTPGDNHAPTAKCAPVALSQALRHCTPAKAVECQAPKMIMLMTLMNRTKLLTRIWVIPRT